MLSIDLCEYVHEIVTYMFVCMHIHIDRSMSTYQCGRVCGRVRVDTISCTRRGASCDDVACCCYM